MTSAPYQRGSARLYIAAVDARSHVVCSQAHSPLRLLIPRLHSHAVWAYTSSFGGGMVAGDQTRLEIRVDQGAHCFLSTQASTKVYRNPACLPCSHDLVATVADDALLILAPDPVQCFTESSYQQRQRFNISESASLLLIDWMSAGRTARGESWNFRRYSSRNEIERAGRTLLLDTLWLDTQHGSFKSRFRGGRFNCLASVLLCGPKLRAYAREILDWCGSQPITPQASLMFSASPLHEGVLLRLAGVSVEEVGHAIAARIGFVRELLGDNPWARKW